MNKKMIRLLGVVIVVFFWGWAVISTYNSSKRPVRSAVYWLPEKYVMVSERPSGKDVITISDIGSFKKAFKGQEISVCPNSSDVVYFCKLGDVVFKTERVEYDIAALGVSIKDIKFAPGITTFSLERSWFAIIGGGSVLGILIGIVVIYSLSILSVILYSLFRLIKKLALWSLSKLPTAKAVTA